jgi:phage shock protein C
MNTQKRLYRSTDERMFAGVCGGIAEYLDVDPTLVRLFFVALTLLSGGQGLLIYIVLMLVVPERPEDSHKVKNEDRPENETSDINATMPTPSNDDDVSSIDEPAQHSGGGSIEG